MKLKETGLMKALRIGFGVFMVILYFLMAALIYNDYFGFTGIWYKLRIVMAIILAAYGIYRCYRMVKGNDFYHIGDRGDD
ncbi:MAG: hypothetical protein IJ835_07535 [Muribaculaceae bacterium]|nr:hypothetical protein [Muribaculaceae bacterium]